jgi:ABC-type polysaccharide/polyol phosphate export permease
VGAVDFNHQTYEGTDAVMPSYLARIWEYRHFWLSLVGMDLRTRYRRSILGVGWSLLQPLLMSCILCAVFMNFLGVAAKEYVPHLLTGLVCWNFLLACALQGCQSFFQAEAYIRQCPLPLGIYPLRTAIGALFHLTMGLTVLVILTSILVGPPPIAALLSLLPTLAILFVGGWSLAVLAGSANVFFQDTQHLAEVGFQLLFYLSPIIYRLEDLSKHPLAWLLKLNPVVPFLSLVRAPLLHHQAPEWSLYLSACALTGLLAVAATATLRKLQDRLIFYL